MRFVSLKCPGCNSGLTVSSNAPPMVTCPNCLTSMANPIKGDGIEPVPVIPLEQVSSSDRKIGASLLVLLGILVLLGAVVTLRSSMLPQLSGVLSIVLVIVAAFSLISGIALFKRDDASISSSTSPRGRAQQRDDILSYESSTRSVGTDAFSEITKGCGIALLILVGLILLLFGVCAVGMLSQSLGH